MGGPLVFFLSRCHRLPIWKKEEDGFPPARWEGWDLEWEQQIRDGSLIHLETKYPTSGASRFAFMFSDINAGPKAKKSKKETKAKRNLAWAEKKDNSWR